MGRRIDHVAPGPVMDAYFDTNVYDRIDKGKVPADEVKALRVALADPARLIASLSLADIEELLGQWDSPERRPDAVRRLRVARDLVGFDRLLKQPADLITEAIQAYAFGMADPTPIMPRHQRRYIAACLSKVADESTALNRVVADIVGDVRRSKEGFKVNMGQARAQALVELTPKYGPDVLRTVPFEAFWTAGGLGWAEDFAAHLGLAEACKERGLEGLLAIRAVRLWVGTCMSIVHAQVLEGRQPDFGDGYDIWHAIGASVAGVFVTFDDRLAGHLKRIPMTDGFRVVTSVPELLAL